MELIKDKVHTCYNCGNTGILKYIDKVNLQDIAHEEDEFGNVLYHDILEDKDWFIFQCPVCEHPVLISEYTCIGMPDGVSEIETVYPVPPVNYEGVPRMIRDSFDAALKTKGIDCSICLLSLRRTLEMICNDKQAAGNSLEKKIHDLVDKKVLPEMLNDACWIIRQLGNEAAHAAEVKFYNYEVEQVIEYVAIVINYLYSLPIRINEHKTKIESRKSS